MTIDIRFEKLLKFSQAARLLPSSRCDRPVAPSTLWRWHKRGVLVNGERVFLDAVRLPSGAATSLEALQLFLSKLGDLPLSPALQKFSSPQRIGDAVEELDLELFSQGVRGEFQDAPSGLHSPRSELDDTSI